MNERIEELIKLASYNIVETDGAPMVSNAFNKEKFANLIVQECIDILKYRDNHAVIVNTIEEIRGHFGVK